MKSHLSGYADIKPVLFLLLSLLIIIMKLQREPSFSSFLFLDETLLVLILVLFI